MRQHVRLVDAGESFDRGAVEADAFLEGVLEFGRRDAHRLQEPQDIGEPESDEPHVTLFKRPEYEVLLLAHGSSLEPPAPALTTTPPAGRPP